MVVGVISTLVLPESTIVVYFRRTPLHQSRSSNAVFQYLVQRLDGTNACRRDVCSFSCELDGNVLPCGANGIVLRNLTINKQHSFLISVATNKGERNSSTYSWFIDRVPPTATISSEETYTNAKRIAVDITFSEPCTELGGFKCLNSSNCDVMATGPAHVLASSLQIMRPGIKYSLQVVLSSKTTYGRVVIQVADNICADQAGNRFMRTNGSSLIIHFDRRPVMVDFWTSVPSYELIINKVPRTVIATSKTDDMMIYLDFSIPLRNSTEQILNALDVNSGILIPLGRHNETRRYAFKLKNILGTEIIKIELQATSIFGRSGTPVSPVSPITFLYDTMKPGVVLKTSSPSVTKESNINIIVEFTKPVFGFEASTVEVKGGRLIRQVEGAIKSSVLIDCPSHNSNYCVSYHSCREDSAPAISIALHSFVSAGTIATSLIAAIFSLSSANLEAISILASGGTRCSASSPSMNLHGMIGHLQVFALSSWFSVNQPIEYSETTRGLQWLIPHHKLPWKDFGTSTLETNTFMAEGHLLRTHDGLSVWSNSHRRDHHQTDLTSWSYTEHETPFPVKINPEFGWLYHRHNISIKSTLYGQPLSSSEYFSYFLRGEPMSAINVIKKTENYKGWRDLEMNLFWLGVGGGSLLLIHVFIVFFLRWRIGKSPQGSLSVPRIQYTDVCNYIHMQVYKEVRQIANEGETSWYMKFWFFFTGKSSNGKWFYREGVPSSFLPRYGILFDSWKGCPMLVFVDQNDPNTHMKWAKSSRSGIGKMKAVSSDGTGSNKELKAPMSKTILGCARSSYIILDLLRRVTLGIISVAYPSEKQSSKSLLALIITLIQLMYLFTFKPFIRRGVQAVETVSLLCEIGVFGIIFVFQNQNQNSSNNPVFEAKTLGLVMLVLLLCTFIAQLINQWYAMLKSLPQLSQPQKNSFRHGLKFAAKGFILPFLPKKHWYSAIPTTSSQPNTELLPVNPLHSEAEFERIRNIGGYMDPTSAMTATVVPVLSPGGPNVIEARDPTTSGTSITTVHREAEGKRIKGEKNELKLLRELAKASFSWDSRVEVEAASTSYTVRK
ncbi:uncharacterized protein G2W53_024873 [Senna tora]|uniref:Uncharacterized protein n=1 Tax=Senna tora TaxID=362788 RepID=A0A834TC11_9FABA|nr:uncharacterized protein G2W53_024873 [Senna tora]